MNSNKVSGWGAYQCLLPGYDLYETIDLARDRKMLIGINISGMAVMAVMFIYAFAWRPEINACFDQELPGILLALAVMVAGYIAYIVLHELVHGIFIRIFSGEKAQYGLQLSKGYAFAKSDYFFGKAAYIVIALAPVVVWGAVLHVLMGAVPDQWYLPVFFIQAMNIGGAVGDYYVTWRILRMPEGVLVIDSGTSMKFFAPVKLSGEKIDE